MKRFAENPNYQAAERVLLRLNALLADSNPSSEELENLREEGTELWQSLHGEERERLQRLSAEMDMFSGNEKARVKLKASAPRRSDRQRKNFTSPEELTIAKTRSKIFDNWEMGRPEMVLDLLRQEPGIFQPEFVAFLRAGAYQKLGHIEVALLFSKWAAARRPQEAIFEFEVQSLLTKSGRLDEALDRARNSIRERDATAGFFLTAALVFSTCVERNLCNENENLTREVASAAEAALKSKPDPFMAIDRVRASGFTIIALAKQRLGDTAGAMHACEEGLAIVADSPALLTIGGLLLVEKHALKAMGMFSKVVAARAPFIPPYFYLANFQLTHSDFRGLKHTCEIAIETLKLDVKSHALLQSYEAIAQFELGASLRTVENLFDASLKSDPKNPAIIENYARFKRFSNQRSRMVRGAPDWTESDEEIINVTRRIRIPFPTPEQFSMNQALSLVS